MRLQLPSSNGDRRISESTSNKPLLPKNIYKQIKQIVIQKPHLELLTFRNPSCREVFHHPGGGCAMGG